jgi:recombination associated protein RdgC
MFFKNLVVYRLPADWALSAAELEQQLSRRPLQPCGPFDMLSRGWLPPTDNGRLLHTVNQQHLIALGVDQKLLPASIIRQVAKERAEALAQEQGFPVGRRQMRDLKMRVTEELRARALTRRRVTRAWIDPQNGWFVVDAAGVSRAEELVEVLRDTLQSFPVQVLETQRSPQSAMSAWLMMGDAPLRFSIDQDLELQAANQSKATIRYARHPLDGKEIRAHLSSGMYPSRLGLTWSDRIAFVLNEKMQIKRLEFLEMSKEPADQSDEIDAAEQFDIDFTVMAGELARLLQDLAQALGNEAPHQAVAA